MEDKYAEHAVDAILTVVKREDIFRIDMAKIIFDTIYPTLNQIKFVKAVRLYAIFNGGTKRLVQLMELE